MRSRKLQRSDSIFTRESNHLINCTCGLDPMKALEVRTRITSGEESSATRFFQAGLAIRDNQPRVSQPITLVLAELTDAPCWRTSRQTAATTNEASPQTDESCFG